jgi:hypothetical protein
MPEELSDLLILFRGVKMAYKNCREEILYTVKQLANTKGEFTVKEVIDRMKQNNTVYKESTITTHISSKCCINSPKNHGTIYNDFERIKPGLYRLVKN